MSYPATPTKSMTPPATMTPSMSKPPVITWPEFGLGMLILGSLIALLGIIAGIYLCVQCCRIDDLRAKQEV
jgi:hypothetical protein